MSLVWRLLPHARPWNVAALVAGSMLLSTTGCKSGGGWWSPGSSKWGSTESSTSDLAVSRPPTRVPTPSSTASPSNAGSLAASGAQNGPYGSANSASGNAPAAQPRSGYGSQPAGWQGEPHSSVAPAGGYQTGGQYGMAANTQPQPGVTPGAYSQPYTHGVTNSQPDATAGGYGAADATSATSAGAAPAGDPAGSIYQDHSQPNGPAATDPSANYDPSAGYAPPASAAPGAVTEPPVSSVPETPLYGDPTAYESSEAANPAASAPAVQEPIANPYSLPSTRPPTSPTPTTAPASSTAPFQPPTLPSSLSNTPGSYRPGSTAAPGSIYGTGYDTAEGTTMR